MPHDWTEEKLQSMDTKSLHTLENNARKKGINDLADRCYEIRVAKRTPKERRDDLGISAFVRQFVGRLDRFADQLNLLFDLSKETAEQMGTTQALKLTAANGKAKVGTLENKNLRDVDRYISYKLGDKKIACTIVLFKDESVDKAHYLVSGSATAVPEGKPSDKYDHPASEVVMEFASLNDAMAEYKTLLSAFAIPRIAVLPTHASTSRA